MAARKKPRGKAGSKNQNGVPVSLARTPQRIADYRERAGLSQAELAAKAGISQGNVSKMEAVGDGSSITGVRLTSVVRVAEALGLSLDELVFGKPDLWKTFVKAVAEGKVTPDVIVPTDSALAPGPGPVQPAGAPASAPTRAKKQR